jgi:uncharacterized protein (DUF924 family)
MDPRARAVLDVWFSQDVIAKELWFKSDPGFDRVLAARFAADYEKAAAGAYDAWQDEAESALALLITLDQFPRNLFRGTPRAFESDTKAQGMATAAVARGFDQAVPPQRRLFFYLPFEHAEDLALQQRSVDLITPLATVLPGVDHYAQRHMELIRAFGRFPHRNEILGRESTAAERAYLAKTPHEFG